MTKSFQDMIYLFSCGAMGMVPQEDKLFDLEKVLTSSISQGVWLTVFLSIKSLYEKDETIGKHHELIETLRHKMLVQVTTNIQRLQIIHKLIKAFEKEDIAFCILKGDSLSHLYAVPECRISSDTDILISPIQKNKSVKILKNLGFDVQVLSVTSHHIRATHPIAGLVELHLELYDELFTDVWFNNVNTIVEPYRFVESSDNLSIPTLGITDGAIFLFLHYIKHFLLEGAGIRQLMDALLYVCKYKNEINWDRFNSLMLKLKYQKLVENLYGIGVKYLNFKIEDLPSFIASDNLIAKILNDIETGGIFGKDEEGRQGFYYEYTKRRYMKSNNNKFDSYINKWWRKKLGSLCFPPLSRMQVLYPYLKKSVFLYPIAWLHRGWQLLIRFCVKKDKKLSAYFDAEKHFKKSHTIEQRLKLIDELDMI